MSKNEFDDWLVGKIQETELAYRPEHWKQLSKKLTTTPKRRIFPLWRTIAACAGLALLMGLGWYFWDKPLATTPDLVKTMPTPTTQPKETIDKQQAPLLKDSESSAKTNRGPSVPTASSGAAATGYHWVAASPHTTLEGQETNTKGTEWTKSGVNESPAQKQETPDLVQHQKSESTTGNSYLLALTPEPLTPDYNKKRTILSVGGGVNYGTVNTGYAIALSARRELGNDFFVDGTVAMMYNGNANQITNYNQAAVRPVARPLNSSTMVSSPAINPSTNNLYYLQFNPTFGYKVDKDISISIGGDLQQMLNTPQPGEIKISTADSKVKVLPTMDIGLTAKSEFDIAPNIQAGMLFREGLNNYFSNNEEFFNRRYIQVQFKYNLPIK